MNGIITQRHSSVPPALRDATGDDVGGNPQKSPAKGSLKILLISTLYHPNIIGGAERSTQFLAESLVQRGHDVIVVTLAPDGESTQVVNGVRVHYVTERNLYWPFAEGVPHPAKNVLWHAIDTYNPFMAQAVGRILDRERPDVVNTHNIAGFSVAVWRATKTRGLPLVHTMRDQYLLCIRTTMFKNGSDCKKQCSTCRMYAWPRMWLTHSVDAVIGVSRFIIDKHLHHGCFRTALRHMIYNAYERPADALRLAPAGEHLGPLRIGYLGRLHPSKGVDQLIHAFGKLWTDEAELWIAGSGKPQDEAALKALAGEQRKVRWMGFVKPESVLGKLDVLVVPSLWHDTAPRVVLEAFAFGVPVIGSNRGGIPELVTDETGWIFDPAKPESLETLLRHCLQDRKRLAAMGASALARSRYFTSESCVGGYLKIYEAVLDDVGAVMGSPLRATAQCERSRDSIAKAGDRPTRRENL
jgi:glycosyltransferase involved in cell wall biosynthesis